MKMVPRHEIVRAALLLSCCINAHASSAEDRGNVVKVSTKDLLSAMRNHDVKWDISPAGLLPSIGGATLLVGKYCGAEVNEQLVAALDDPDRFVAAHVLLALRLLKEVSVSGDEFDHLRVILNVHGPKHVSEPDTIDPGQRARLKDLWKERLKPPDPKHVRDPALR